MEHRLIKSYCISLSHIQFEISLLINIVYQEKNGQESLPLNRFAVFDMFNKSIGLVVKHYEISAIITWSEGIAKEFFPAII